MLERLGQLLLKEINLGLDQLLLLLEVELELVMVCRRSGGWGCVLAILRILRLVLLLVIPMWLGWVVVWVIHCCMGEVGRGRVKKVVANSPP